MSIFQSLTVRLVRAVTSVFPKNAKRVLLMATLASMLASPEDINNETVQRLRKVLELDAEDNDLSLAFTFTKVCWEGTEVEALCNIPANEIGDVDDFVQQVVPKVPDWIRYQPETMERDIRQLVEAVVETKA